MNWMRVTAELTRVSQSGGAGSTVYFVHTIWHWLDVLNILQHALDRFSAACENTEVRYMSLYKTKAVYAASEVEKFKCLGWRSSST